MADQNQVTNAIGGYLKGLGGWAKEQADITGSNIGDFFHRIGHNVADSIDPQKLVSPLPQDNQPTVQQPSLFDQWAFHKQPIDTTTDNHIYSSYNMLPNSYMNGSIGDPPIDTNSPLPTTTPDIRPTQPNTLASTLSNPQTQLPQTTGAASSFFNSGWTPKYASLWENNAKSSQGITPDMIKTLVTSENGTEDPNALQYNYKMQYAGKDRTGKDIYNYVLDKNGQKIPESVDVGLSQINVPINDTNTIAALKNPELNVREGVKRLAARMNNLGDPVLAMASWNLGPGGVIKDPQKALQRAQTIYAHAGIPLPQTPFTQNPQGFISQNMDKYKKLGLL